MQIEYITRISLTSGRTSDEKRQSTVCYSMLGKVIIDNENIFPLFSEIFGKFYFLDVGAFGVGSIVNTAEDRVEHAKLDEKGFFKFGGSTVILVMDSARIKFDDDLVKNSANKLETIIRCGEQIARAV